MALKDEDRIPDNEQEQYVPAVFARDEKEAEAFRELLADHDIEALVGYEQLKTQPEREATEVQLGRGLPVLVPEALLDEASAVISDREDQDEFELGEELEDEDEDEDKLDFELEEEPEYYQSEEEDDLFEEGEDSQDLLEEDEDEEYY